MKAFLAALVALVAITAGANYALLNYAGFSAAERTAVGQSVRID
jgi:hypothetical protein